MPPLEKLFRLDAALGRMPSCSIANTPTPPATGADGSVARHRRTSDRGHYVRFLKQAHSLPKAFLTP
jgi:hypothetical protein